MFGWNRQYGVSVSFDMQLKMWCNICFASWFYMIYSDEERLGIVLIYIQGFTDDCWLFYSYFINVNLTSSVVLM